MKELKNVVYSFRNASSDNAEFSKNPFKILENYNLIMSFSWKDDNDLKQIMQSEVLILENVPVFYINRIFVQEKNFQWVKNILKNYSYNIELQTKCEHIKDLFFEVES